MKNARIVSLFLSLILFTLPAFAQSKIVVSYYGGLIVSTDNGVTWTPTSPLPGDAGREYFTVMTRNVAFGSRAFYYAGGGNWQSLPGTKGVSGQIDVAFAPTAMVSLYAVGNSLAMALLCRQTVSVCASSDGYSWMPMNVLPGDAQAKKIAFNKDTFVVIGGPEFEGRIYSGKTSDTTWTLAKSIPQHPLIAVTSGNNMFVAADTTFGSQNKGTLWVSQDGRDWNQSASMDCQMKDIVWGKDKFVGICSTSTGSSYTTSIYTSSNGLAWTKQTASSDKELYSVSYINDQFIGVGDGGTIMTSPDGITWTKRNSGTQQSLMGVGEIW